MEIELPDGTILEAPDGSDPEVVAKAYLAKQGQSADYKPQLDRWGAFKDTVSDTGSQLGRQFALTGRALAEGAYDVVSPFTNAIAGTMNLGLGAVGADYRFPEQSSAFSQQLTQWGVPAPETSAEKAGNFAGRLVTSVGTGSAATKAVMGRLGYPTQTLAPQKPPTTDELRKLANQAYQSADDAGVVINPQSFAARVQQISNDIAKEGLDETLHPRATAALKRLQEAASGQKPLTLQETETLRRVVKNAASSLQADERRIARLMTDQLDDYVRNLQASDVVSGNAATASAALREARNLWSRMSKGEVVEELIERAGTRAGQFSGSGYENALRTEFRNLVLNPRRFRMFTVPEQQALRRVAEGGPLGNLLRMIGKAAPTGVVSSALGTGAGYAVGGPLGAAAVPAVGFAARQGATALTMRNATLASELMRQAQRPPLLQPATSALLQYLPGAVGTTNAIREEYLSNHDQ